MKTTEELNALKGESSATREKLAELTSEELEHVSGGDMEVNFDLIMQYINSGNDYMAREYFELAQYRLAAFEAYSIRMAFWAKFGYPIDKFG